MKISVLKSLEEIISIKEQWALVLRKQRYSTINYVYDWILLNYKHFGDAKYNRFFVVEDDNEIVGMFPMIATSWKTAGIILNKQLAFVGDISGVTDFCDFIIKDNRLDVIDYFFKYLRIENHNWDILQLKYLTDGSSNISAIINVLNQNMYEYKLSECTKVLYINMKSYAKFENYYNSLGRNLRRELTKRLYKFEDIKDYSFRRNEQMPASELTSLIVGLYNQRQQQMGREGFGAQTKTTNFLIDLINLFRANHTLEYSIIYVKEKPISYTLGFRYENVYYHWSIGFDINFSHLSPNKVHHKLLIESCFTEGLHEFNFMRGDSEYKFKWTTSYRSSNLIKVLNTFTIRNKLIRQMKHL